MCKFPLPKENVMPKYLLYDLTLQPDSGFFCEENSSDDDAILKEEFRGLVVKQGCLLKQVSIFYRTQYEIEPLQPNILLLQQIYEKVTTGM